MRKRIFTAAALAVSLLTSVSNAQTMYGITGANSIFTMSNISTPSVIGGPYAISGVASGQVLVGLDSRPSTGGLYALGYDSTMMTGELYMITASGTSFTASPVTGTLASINLGTMNQAAFDFVSTMGNEIRIIGRNGNNYVMNAGNGTIMSTGTSGLSFASGDLHSGAGIVAATAYTNSFFGSDVTQEVAYDAANNVLVKMDAGIFANSFNNTSNTVHSIGITTGTTLMAGGDVGMDTWYDTLMNTNTVYLTGTPLLGTGAHLYKYDLSGTLGVMTDLGAIGSGALDVKDIAFATVRDSTSPVMGQLLTGLSLNMRNLVYFDSYHPENILKEVMLNGMAAGQEMIAIDYSTNGALYGLGYNSVAHTYQLYTVDTLTGSVTAVNATPGSLNLGTDDGSGNYINAGFRFMATAPGRIRVTGNNGIANVQLDAATGAIIATDTALSYITGDLSFGGTANLTSIAFTGFGGDTATHMFGFDANTGAMVQFDAGNSLGGFGNGSSGYINTDVSLSSILALLLHTSAYNNSFMNITYDASTAANIGYLASNYDGDSSSALVNYSMLYDMSGMLSGYHKGTAGTPATVGRIGYATPVKDIAIRRAPAVSTAILNTNNTTNDLLLYPNPVIDKTQIQLPYPVVGKVNVDIIDPVGNVVHTSRGVNGASLITVDMSNFPSGLYTVSVYGASVGVHNLRVVKQ